MDVASGGSQGNLNPVVGYTPGQPISSSNPSSAEDASPAPIGVPTKITGSNTGISGLSVIKTINTQEQGVVNGLMHYNSDIASMIVYSTQRGGVHAWDMRSYKDAFSFPIRSELGSISSMTMAPDRNWICVGTTEGMFKKIFI